MGLPFPGVGIIFNIDDLGGGYYGPKAWRIFMRHLDPTQIPACTLMEGDTNATLEGHAREFCIAIYGLIDVDYIKGLFADLQDKGLAKKSHRFIEKSQLDSEPLVHRGRIDASGAFVTESWARVDHDLCKEVGWRYRPENIPDDLPAAPPAEKTAQETDWLRSEARFFEFYEAQAKKLIDEISTAPAGLKEDLEQRRENLNKRIQLAKKNPSLTIEVPLGAELNFYSRVFNISDGGIYNQMERCAILKKFIMMPPDTHDEAHVRSMAPEEFVVRAVYFGRGFWNGTHSIEDAAFPKFVSAEPLIGMLDYDQERVRKLCIGLIEEWLSLPAVPEELSKVISRIRSREAMLAFLKLVEERVCPELLPALLQITIDEVDHEMLLSYLRCINLLCDAGAAQHLCQLFRNITVSAIKDQVKKALANIKSTNNKFRVAFPHVSCDRCSSASVMIKAKLSMFRQYKLVICPKCQMSAFLAIVK